MNFNQLYSLLFEEFKKSPEQIHLYDIPMFSVYVKEGPRRSILKSFYQTLPITHKELKEIFASAKNKINKMGFPSMHVNVLFNDLREEINRNTGGGVGGYAHRKGKYMTISISSLNNLKYLEKVIIHEWAHLWMFNNSAGFKKAVKEFYNKILHIGKSNYANKDTETDRGKRFGYGIRDLIDNKSTDEFYTLFTKEFSQMISRIYEKELTWQNPTVDEYFRQDAKEGRESPSSIRGAISAIVGSMIDLYNSKFRLYEDHIKPKNNKEILDKIIDTISNNIFYKDKIYDYADRAIRSEREEYIGDDYDRVLTPEEESEMYGNMYLRTEHNKYLLRTGPNDSYYDIIFPMVFEYYPGSPHEYFEIINNGLHDIIQNQKDETDEKNLNAASDLSGMDYNDIRRKITPLVEWVDEYGLSNDDEIWATGIEEFVKLPDKYKKEIMRLMQTQDRRDIPNRTMRKKMK